MSRSMWHAESEVWSWADVRTPRRNQPGGGRPPHSVTLGHMDTEILSLARDGEPVVGIARKLGCGEAVVSRRLQALGARGSA